VGGAPIDLDVVVIGSGFGGSVAALRLTEKGYRVGILEAGRRADLVVLDHNPLHDVAVFTRPADLKAVIKGGRVVAGSV